MSLGESDARRLRLIDRLLRVPDDRLVQLEHLLDSPPAPTPAPVSPPTPREWPHAPLHRISEQGTYVVTAGTYQKEHFFSGTARLDGLERELLAAAEEARWQLEAWAVFSNHYHFVGHAQAASEDLSKWIARLHHKSAAAINLADQCAGRKVWCNYWDTKLTFERSYFARLNYVHQNAVRHGLVRVANQYRWCSAAWFERTAPYAQVRTIYRFKTDKVRIHDEFVPI